MATGNPFDLLGDDDHDDPSRLIAIHEQKAAAKKLATPTAPAPAKLPSKPLPPAQAVRESRSNATVPALGGGGRGAYVRGRGGRGGGPRPDRGFANGDANGSGRGYGADEVDAGKPSDKARGNYGSQRGSLRGGRRGGFRNGEAEGDGERPPRRMYERHSGTGRSNEIKREGSGRGNWGTTNDELLAQITDKNVNADEIAQNTEKPPEKQEDESALEVANDTKDTPEHGTEEKEPDDKEMTLEEYEKVREEKRKALLAMKSEERKVEFDKDFESMQQLSMKKGDDVFVKLGSDKDMGKKKDNAEREERAKKSMNITEFLKPAEGETYYGGRGRGCGRGRGRGERDGPLRTGGAIDAAPLIKDPQHFPTLGAK